MPVITDDPIRLYAELPEKSTNSEQWLASVGKPLITGIVAVNDEQQHLVSQTPP